jgi:hypothetical protein
MDAYTEDYVVHNLPFILLSGLEADPPDDAESSGPEYPLLLEKGPRIYSDFPPLSGPTVEELRRNLLEEDASGVAWDNRESTSTRYSGIGYKIKSVGRVGSHSPHESPPPRRPSCNRTRTSTCMGTANCNCSVLPRGRDFQLKTKRVVADTTAVLHTSPAES